MIEGRESAAVAMWLLEQLGEGSASVAAVRGGPQHRPWTTENRLAAAMVSALRDANWQRGGGRGSRPKAIEPPTPAKVAGRRDEQRPRRRSALANRATRRMSHAGPAALPAGQAPRRALGRGST